MNLVSVKSLSEVALHGVKIDWTKEDKTIKEIRLHDGNGGRVVIKLGESYTNSLKVMVPQPFEEADRYLLAGDLAGLTTVREFFDDKYSAENKLSDYAEKVRGEHGLTVKKVKVMINEAGDVVDEAKPSPAAEGDISF